MKNRLRIPFRIDPIFIITGSLNDDRPTMGLNMIEFVNDAALPDLNIIPDEPAVGLHWEPPSHANSLLRWNFQQRDGTAIDFENGHNATFGGTPIYEDDASVTFDGFTDYLDIDVDVAITNPFTVIMEGLNLPVPVDGILFTMTSGANSYVLYGGGGLSIWDGSAKGTGYTWTGTEDEIAVVFNGTTCNVYIDGVVTPSSPITITSHSMSAANIRLMMNTAGGQPRPGRVYYFEIIEAALTGPQVIAEHARRNP